MMYPARMGPHRSTAWIAFILNGFVGDVPPTKPQNNSYAYRAEKEFKVIVGGKEIELSAAIT
jgi:hypothetical protein